MKRPLLIEDFWSSRSYTGGGGGARQTDPQETDPQNILTNPMNSYSKYCNNILFQVQNIFLLCVCVCVCVCDHVCTYVCVPFLWICMCVCLFAADLIFCFVFVFKAKKSCRLKVSCGCTCAKINKMRRFGHEYSKHTVLCVWTALI